MYIFNIYCWKLNKLVKVYLRFNEWIMNKINLNIFNNF